MRVERQGDVALWTIDRPAAKNALDFATLEALTNAARSVDRAVRAVVLTGAGDVFVSGGDLRELRNRQSASDADALSDAGFALTEALATLHCPVIAAIGGSAIGGGAELAVACDLRVASPQARIAFKQVRMGVTTAWGAADRLVQLVGRGQAARLLFTAEAIGAEEARAIGLVDAVADDALAAALAWAGEIAKGSPAAITAMKRVLAASGDRALERRLFAEAWASPDHHDAVEAYFEKRPPRWR